MDKPLRALYICYLSLDDPLVHTQVVAYLAGLAARGHAIHLLTYDRPLAPARRAELHRKLEQAGIAWHSLRYHKRPSLPATIYDALRGALTAVRLIRRFGLDAVHARNHVPLATALIARRLTGCRLIFDIRGLMAEEYVDAGRWKHGGVPYRLTRRIQDAGLKAADAVVVLTEAVRAHLRLDDHRRPVEVIPCCADLEQLAANSALGDAVRAELGLGERPVMAYVGKFTGWYMEPEMADFFAVARRRWPELAFLVITQADAAVIRREFERLGVSAGDYRITSARAELVGRYLAAADFGISFIRRSPSKISSSPTKIGEYLGAGLPVLSSAGIGDVDALLDGERVGVLVRSFGEASYLTAIDAMHRLADETDVEARCRVAARRHLSLADVGIPRYDRLYRGVAAHGR